MPGLRRFLVLPLALIAAPLPAQEPALNGPEQNAPELDGAAEAKGPRGVQLVRFDGGREFLSTSERMRIWRPEVGYRMEVDATGKATSCTIIDKFRQTYINLKLCEILLEHHTFAPALNAASEPVAGIYEHSLVYTELRAAE